MILPGVPLDVVAYGCTSGAMVIGEDRVAERIRAARPDVAVTTPITGALAALQALGAKRIALADALYRPHQPDDARLHRSTRFRCSVDGSSITRTTTRSLCISAAIVA